MQDGEEVTICKKGEPVVDLVRTRNGKSDSGPKYGTGRGKIIIHDPNWAKGIESAEELQDWLEGKIN